MSLLIQLKLITLFLGTHITNLPSIMYKVVIWTFSERRRISFTLYTSHQLNFYIIRKDFID